MLAKEDDDKNERVVYYLSKRFHDYETRYTPIESHALLLYGLYKNEGTSSYLSKYG